MKLSKKDKIDLVKKLRVPAVFLIFYIICSLFLIFLPVQVTNSDAFQFITSWFNPSEDFYYGNLSIGLLENFILPLIYMGFILVCLVILKKRELGGLSLELSFLSGIIATYVVSGVQWAFYSGPGTGTSIVAACLLTVLIPLSFATAYFIKKDRIINQPKVAIVLFIVFIGLAIFLCFILLFSLFINNHSWYLHLSGIAISIPILIAALKIKKFIQNNNSKEKIVYSAK